MKRHSYCINVNDATKLRMDHFVRIVINQCGEVQLFPVVLFVFLHKWKIFDVMLCQMILILSQVRCIFQRWISDKSIRDDIIYEHRHLLSLYVTVMLYLGYQFFLVFFLHFVQKLSFAERILSEREGFRRSFLSS